MSTQTPGKRPAAHPPRSASEAGAPDPLAGAFERPIEPVPTSPGYVVALGVVAIVMVALPLVYIAIIAAVAWATWFHATHNVTILAGHGNAKGKLFVYAGPIAIGVAVVILLLKPLFASRQKEAPPHLLDERKEPRLFAFVRRLCDCVGAPRPSEIVLDCTANASASFARGLASGSLRLTIGLPLVAELELRELAGVLAHEFGHFSQGAGMRFTYLIRSVNAWFARVVFERDGFDEWIAANAEGVLGALAKAAIWLTRKVLFVLMLLGHAVSCALMRRMEYDADLHEIRLAGSAAFESTARKLPLLSIAERGALGHLGASLEEGWLPEDFGALVSLNVKKLPKEALAKIRAHQDEAATGLLDTHPADADRIAAARREEEEGVFRAEGKARILFADYEAASRAATISFLKSALGPAFRPDRMISTKKVAARDEAAERCTKAYERFHGEEATLPSGVRLDPALLGAPAQPKAALAAMRDAAAAMEKGGRAAVKEASDRLGAAREKGRNAAKAAALVRAKLSVPKELGIAKPSAATALAAAKAAKAKIDDASGRLEEAARPAVARLTSAISLLHVEKIAARIEGGGAAKAARAKELAGALATVLDAERAVDQTVTELSTIIAIMEAAQGSEAGPEVGVEVDACAKRLRDRLREARDALAQAPYPFDHAERTTVGAFCVEEVPSASDIGAMLEATKTLVERAGATEYRIQGELAAIALEVEEVCAKVRSSSSDAARPARAEAEA